MMGIGFIFLGYVLGSIPFGLLVSRWLCSVDPRSSGSGNVGATNVGRTCGMSMGVLTLVLDLLKGMTPVLLALDAGLEPAVVSLVGFAALFGHCYSMFLGFKGGKAVATTIGVFLPLAWLQMLLAVGVLLALLLGTGFMSVASLGLAASLFIFLLIGKPVYAPLGAAAMVLVFWRHRENILRLARGEENPWRKKKS